MLKPDSWAIITKLPKDLLRLTEGLTACSVRPEAEVQIMKVDEKSNKAVIMVNQVILQGFPLDCLRGKTH